MTPVLVLFPLHHIAASKLWQNDLLKKKPKCLPGKKSVGSFSLFPKGKESSENQGCPWDHITGLLCSSGTSCRWLIHWQGSETLSSLKEDSICPPPTSSPYLHFLCPSVCLYLYMYVYVYVYMMLLAAGNHATQLKMA